MNVSLNTNVKYCNLEVMFESKLYYPTVKKTAKQKSIDKARPESPNDGDPSGTVTQRGTWVPQRLDCGRGSQISAAILQLRAAWPRVKLVTSFLTGIVTMM
jgi:hypothetical protein